MSSVGVMALAAKPYHSGHHRAVLKAAGECDSVVLFVSLGDRKRPGEIPILGSDMARIWKEQIEPILPSNVTVQYVRVPVASVYAAVGEIDKSASDDTVIIYGDAEDLSKNFPDAKLAKYFPTLTATGRVETEPTERYFSGTKMRQMLADGDSTGFKKMLPAGLDKDFVWDLLHSRVLRAENVLPTLREIFFG